MGDVCAQWTMTTVHKALILLRLANFWGGTHRKQSVGYPLSPNQAGGGCEGVSSPTRIFTVKECSLVLHCVHGEHNRAPIS